MPNIYYRPITKIIIDQSPKLLQNYNKWTASLYDAHRERAREREGERETGGIHSDSQMGILVVLSTTDYYNKREREIRRGRGRERYTNIHTM